MFLVIIMHTPPQVIPPGMDFSSVVVPEDTSDGDDGKDFEIASPRSLPPIWAEVGFWISSSNV